MPSYNSVRLNDRKRTTGLREQPVKTNENQSVNWVESELARRPRRSTLICCLNTKISASSVARDRKRSVNIRQISLQRSNITQQHHRLRQALGSLVIIIVPSRRHGDNAAVATIDTR